MMYLFRIKAKTERRQLNISKFLGVTDGLINPNILNSCVIILLCGVGLNFILKSINSIIYSIQKSSLNNVISLISSILPLLYILIAPSGTLSENLIRISVVHIISINLPLITATLALFYTKCKEFRPKLSDFDFKIAKTLFNVGGTFFLAQIFFMFLMSTNEIFITKLFGAEYVVEYNAYYKIFMLVGSIFMLAITPVWSKITKDYSECNFAKIIKINKIMYLLAIVATIFEFIVVFILQWIFDVWLQEASFKVNLSTALIFAFWGGLYIFNIILTTVANGIGDLRTQIIFYGIGATLKIPISLILKSLLNNWNIVVLYNCIILSIFCITQYVWLEKKLKGLDK